MKNLEVNQEEAGIQAPTAPRSPNLQSKKLNRPLTARRTEDSPARPHARSPAHPELGSAGTHRLSVIVSSSSSISVVVGPVLTTHSTNTVPPQQAPAARHCPLSSVVTSHHHSRQLISRHLHHLLSTLLEDFCNLLQSSVFTNHFRIVYND